MSMTPAMTPPETRPETVIEAHDLSVSYSATPALVGVSFRAIAGEVIAVVGPNGAGKSSMMKALAGLVPHGGRVSFHGHNCHHNELRHTVAYIPQRIDLDLDFPINAEDVVLTGRRRFRRTIQRPNKTDRQVSACCLARVGASHLARRHLGTLSGGELQRVLLARALAQEADVLLLDEALSGVDQPTRNALTELFMLLGAQGTTLLVSTHDLELTRHHFERCLAINRTVVADGNPLEILDANTVEATFARAN
jgi:manganese/iron transport system ATP-binding protein